MTIMVLLDFDIKEGKLDQFLKISEDSLPHARSNNFKTFSGLEWIKSQFTLIGKNN